VLDAIDQGSDLPLHSLTRLTQVTIAVQGDVLEESEALLHYEWRLSCRIQILKRVDIPRCHVFCQRHE